MNMWARLTLIAAAAAMLSILPLLELTQDSTWIFQAGLAIVLVALVGLGARLIRVPAVLTALIQLVVVAWWVGLLVARDQAWLGVFPSTEWPARFYDVYVEGARAITEGSTPVLVGDGILIYLVSGAGVLAFFVDLFSVSLRRPVLTGLPLAAGYAIAVGIERGDTAWWWFVPPAVAFMAMLIMESRSRLSAWGEVLAPAGESESSKSDTLVRNGQRVGVVALSAAVAIPAFVPLLSAGILPGLNDDGEGGQGGRTIRTDNPILDLQRNLSRPDNVDLLRYRASDETGHYIRTVTLDSFDGEVWKTSDRPVPESQRVRDGMPDPPGMDLDDPSEVRYQFAVTENYSSRWLPLVYPAQDIEIEGDWRYDRATLDVVSTDEDVLGTDYTTVSLDISPTANQLREAEEPEDDDIRAMTELPGNLPEIVGELAEAITANATDDFSRAAALQAWFRGPNFTYDISTQPGTSASALGDFLTERRGYCEQFSASMAIMARHLGIPARVAVGFTPGTFEGNGTWRIRAHDAHAWPELYFRGAGWVRFEPTPAARTGSPPVWTVPPEELAANNQDDDTDDDEEESPTDDPSASPGAGSGLDDDDDDRAAIGVWPLAAGGVLSLGAVLACVPRGLATIRHRRRWSRAGDDDVFATANAAWTDLGDAVRDAGFVWDMAATPRTMGRSLAINARLSDERRALLDHLVKTIERARYARNPELPPGLRADTARFCRDLVKTQPLGRRMQAFLWPTTLSDAWAVFKQKVKADLRRCEIAILRLRAALVRVIVGEAR